MNVEAAFAVVYGRLIRYGMQLKPTMISDDFLIEAQKMFEQFLMWSKTGYRNEGSGREINKQIDILLKFIFVCRNFNPDILLVCLRVEKELLAVRSMVIEPVQKIKKRKIYSESEFRTTISDIKEKNESLKKKIYAYIEQKGELASTEIYDFFPETNKRTIRRLLTELLDSGSINRIFIDRNKSLFKAGR